MLRENISVIWKIKIVIENGNYEKLEVAMERRFGLKEVFIVPRSYSAELLHQNKLSVLFGGLRFVNWLIRQDKVSRQHTLLATYKSLYFSMPLHLRAAITRTAEILQAIVQDVNYEKISAFWKKLDIGIVGIAHRLNLPILYGWAILDVRQ